MTFVLVLGLHLGAKIQNGLQLFWDGNPNSDCVIDALDRGLTWNDRNQTGYLENMEISTCSPGISSAKVNYY